MDRKSLKIIKMNGRSLVVAQLLAIRFIQTDTFLISTARDLFISAIISGVFLVRRREKTPNSEGNFTIFESREAEQPTVMGLFRGRILDSRKYRKKLRFFRKGTIDQDPVLATKFTYFL